MKHLLATACLALALAGCGSLTPASTVYTARATFVGGLELATNYGALPKCVPAGPAICHDAGILKTIQKSAHVADAALDTAEEVARNPAFGKDAASSALIAADGAVKAFRNVTDALRVR